MLILTIRTDKPDAEVGLFEGNTKLNYEAWPAHRELAATLHQKIDDCLKQQGKSLKDLAGIVVFQGPGSFTGLRIGITVADTLAYALEIAIVAAQGENWTDEGIMRLEAGENDRIALPHYGAEAHITTPKN